MSVTAVIVAYRSERTITACIASALEAGVENVVVWDNSAGGLTRELVGAAFDARVQVLGDGENHGFGGGVNRALPQVSSELVLLLNPDCVISAEALRALEDALELPGAGVVAPRMVYPDGTPGIAGGPPPSVLKELLASLHVDDHLPSSVRQSLLRSLDRRRAGAGYADSLVPGEPVDIDWVSGFCMVFHVSFLREIGGFDEDFFLYFEDVDLCMRVSDAGRRVLLARDAVVLHHESASMGSEKSRHYRTGFGVFLRKHRSAPSRLLARVTGVAQ